MNIIAWIFVGLVAGLLARWIVRDDRSGCVYTVAVGVLGALIGGALDERRRARGHQRFQPAIVGRRRARSDLAAVGAAGDRRRRAAVSGDAASQPLRSWRTRSFGLPMIAFFFVTTTGRCMSCLCLSSTATT